MRKEDRVRQQLIKDGQQPDKPTTRPGEQMKGQAEQMPKPPRPEGKLPLPD